ncbi:glutathione S-transferase [Mucor mucedo]|uniref:glutathione S-transferase n=1 Tax=Mucor mucedo TaxID=29922 RepID=UPI00221F7003|nr:glutathione S-transferase [Mucor mucedo]KAI7890511.1 glutathione S-transferase [Mucor mucedo]
MSSLSNIKLHYFTVVKGSPVKGRGEHVRLLLEDAGVDFEYVRHTGEEWGALKQKLLSEKIRAPTMPFITIDGKYYGKTFPTMRYLSKKLNKYEGSNDDETQLLDVYTDIVGDWTLKWSASSFGAFTEEASKNYKENIRPQFHNTFNDILSDTKGPFLLGENISYADFALYHILEDDIEGEVNVKTLPYLSAFFEAVQNRPNLKTYLATDRK